MGKYKIAVIPGDGIGIETADEAIKVLKAVQAKVDDLELQFDSFPWGSEYYLAQGEMMPENALEILGAYDSIYLGAIGDPRIPDHITLREMLLKLRVGFDQYINLRPVKLLEGVATLIKNKTEKDIDFMVVRENTEGFYTGTGGRYEKGTPAFSKYAGLRDPFAASDEVVVQEGVFSRVGVERVMRYAFELARKRKKHLTCCTKSNAMNYAMVYWDEIFKKIAEEYPDVTTDFAMVDALCMWFVKNPEFFDVVVADNLFGDIITDLGAAIQGGMGLAPGGNINPGGISMFEPIHGSAPRHAGKSVADPVASIWAAQMMLEQLGESEAADRVMKAIEAVLREGKIRTGDLGGTSSTVEVGNAIAGAI